MKANLKTVQNVSREEMEMVMGGFKILAEEAEGINLSYFSNENNVDRSVNSINKFAKEEMGIEVSTEFLPSDESIVFCIRREENPSKKVLIELVEEEPSKTYN